MQQYHPKYWTSRCVQVCAGLSVGVTTSATQRFTLVCWLLLVAGAALAAGVPSASAEQADVRLVIDISGSMKRNDPQNLRQPAVNLLMELLPDASHAGVWTFGKEVNMLVPFGRVDESWRDMATQKAQQINSIGLYTNIGSALETATKVGPAASKKAHIILLTDGMVDIDKNPEVNKKEWRRIVDDVLPVVKERGFSIHTIALSEHADNELMKKLSLATDGHAAMAKTAEQLMPAFLKAFDAAAPSQQLPLSGNRFVVDSSVEEFTALMFRDHSHETIALVGPDNARLEHGELDADVSWHHTDNYDLVTINRPLEGQWQVVGELASGSRITVVSDLNLRVKPLPLNVPVGSALDLQLALQEDNKILARPDFLKLLSIEAKATFLHDGTTPWRHTFNTQAPPSNGVFSTSAAGFDNPGDYRIDIALDGKSFQRSFSHPFTVSLPFETEIVKGYNDNSQREYRLLVRKNAQHIQPENTQMALSLTTPDRRKQVYPIELNDHDVWQYAVLPQREGKYGLEIRITGVNDRGDSFEYVLHEQFSYAPEDDFAALLAEQPASSVSSAASSTSAAASSAISSESSSAPAVDTSQDAVNGEGGGGAWIFYAALGIGNLLLLGLAAFVVKKLIGPATGKKQEEPPVASETPPAEDAPVPAEEPADDPGVMEMDDIDDEIPPMEDLEPEMDFEEDDLEDDDASAPEEPPADDENFDFDLSALDADDDDTPATQPSEPAPEVGEPDSDESVAPQEDNAPAQDDAGDEEDDMADAMLKAQGLDLAEDELDDAISNLIDELDDDAEASNKPDDKADEQKKPGSNMAGEINLDDFDFDDDGDK
ncbi:MAG TPA: vWA domain-containing protein [Marinagarivorans sp.]